MGRYKNDYLKQFSSSKKINDLSLVKTFWILIKNHIRIQISGWIRIRKKQIRILNTASTTLRMPYGTVQPMWVLRNWIYKRKERCKPQEFWGPTHLHTRWDPHSGPTHTYSGPIHSHTLWPHTLTHTLVAWKNRTFNPLTHCNKILSISLIL